MANSVIIIFLLIILRLSELRRLRRMQDYWQQTKFSMKFSVKSWWHKGPIFPRIVNRVVGCPCLGDNQQFRISKNCVGLQDFSWAQNIKYISTTILDIQRDIVSSSWSQDLVSFPGPIWTAVRMFHRPDNFILVVLRLGRSRHAMHAPLIVMKSTTSHRPGVLV